MKPGYKKTEVGVIPEDWGVSTVGCEFEVKLGKMLDAEKNVGVSKPYLGNKAVQWDRIDISDLPTVPMSRADIERFRLRRGDLLVCEGGEVGRAAIWDGPIEECYYQKAIHRLRPVGGFDSRVMAALLRLWSDRGQLVNYVTQTSIAHLPREKFMEVPMPVPPPMEQRAIAEALGDVDALLGALEQLIAKKRDLKQAAMQQLLTGQKRLPGFALSDRLKHTDVGVVPEDWKVQKVGEIATVGRGRVISHREISNALSPTYPVYSSQTSDGGVMGYIGTFDFEGEYITWTTDGANAGTVFHRNGRFNCTNVCGTIKLTRDNAIFAAKVLGRFVPRHVSRNLGNPKLMNDVMKRIQIPLPPNVQEQTAIAEVLSVMDAELAALEQRLAKTRDLKQGMMQELLTGRTRLV